MDARSGQARRKVTSTKNRSEFNPAWSPNGRRIAFASVDSQTFLNDIYSVNARGGGGRLLTDPLGSFGGDEPAWSPNGKKIVYRLFSGSGWLGLGLMKANGDPLSLGLPPTQSSFADQNPDWQAR
jgi:Tol biopolymer transport system component